MQGLRLAAQQGNTLTFQVADHPEKTFTYGAMT